MRPLTLNTKEKASPKGTLATLVPFSAGKGNNLLAVADPPMTERRAALNYNNNRAVQNQIHNLKYRGQLALATVLAERLTAEYRRANWTPAPTLICAVPLAPARLRERGFNQSTLLANELSKAVGVPMLEGTLRRIRYERPQVGLGARQRLLNMEGAFTAERALASGQRVVLVDDVCTTGATLRAAAQALIDAGAACVYALTIAAVPLEPGQASESTRHAVIRIVTRVKNDKQYRYAQLVMTDGRTKSLGALNPLTAAPLLTHVLELISNGKLTFDELLAIQEARKDWRDMPIVWSDVS